MPFTNLRLAEISYASVVKGKTPVSAKTVTVRVNKKGETLKLQLGSSPDDSHTVLYTLSPPPNDPTKTMWTMDLVIPHGSETYNLLSDLDERNVQEGIAKSAEWFGRGMDEDGVREAYTPILRFNDKQNLWVARVKVNVGEKMPTKVYEHETGKLGENVKTACTYESIRKGSRCFVKLESPGLWVMNRSFGMSLFSKSVLVFPWCEGGDCVSDDEFEFS